MAEKKITNKVLTKMFWRLNLLQCSWNYERMQSLGYLNSMVPALKEIYKDSTPEERAEVAERQLAFFNTMPTLTAPILGINVALEEAEKNKVGSVVSTLKVALMGPFAGLGDSMIWLTWMPIWMSIGASMAATGNAFGLVLAFVMFNILNQGIKFYGIRAGYNQGVKLLDRMKESNLLQRYSAMASILGLMVVGGLIPQMVRVYIPFELTIDELSVSIQSLIDDIVPSLLPLLLTLACASLLNRRKSAVLILLVIIVAAILLSAIGVLG